jgi:hypothetical protein
MKYLPLICLVSVFLVGCATQTKQDKWVEQTNMVQSKQEIAINDCRIQANKQVGNRPIAQKVPQCNNFNPSCSYAQGQTIGANQKEQNRWQQSINDTFQSCMHQKGYAKE